MASLPVPYKVFAFPTDTARVNVRVPFKADFIVVEEVPDAANLVIRLGSPDASPLSSNKKGKAFRWCGTWEECFLSWDAVPGGTLRVLLALGCETAFAADQPIQEVKQSGVSADVEPWQTGVYLWDPTAGAWAQKSMSGASTLLASASRTAAVDSAVVDTKDARAVVGMIDITVAPAAGLGIRALIRSQFPAGGSVADYMAATGWFASVGRHTFGIGLGIDGGADWVKTLAVPPPPSLWVRVDHNTGDALTYSLAIAVIR